MNTVVVYATFAPLHSARLEAAHAFGMKDGHSLTGIEIASSQRDYQWPESPSNGQQYQHLTLFPQNEYWSLSYRTVKRTLHDALDALRPDVVVLPGWSFKESIAGLGWCINRGVPRVLISDSQPMDSSKGPGKMWIRRLLAGRFQAGFVGGAPHVRYLKDLGLPYDRCTVGCDVVDNDMFARESKVARASLKRDQGSTLLSCLRLIPKKNILSVAEALASRPSWTWIVAGDGPDRPKLEQKLAQLGIGDRVHLLGHVDYYQLPKIYAQADIYLQPSLYEPWGLAVNEAMACGLPVIVSNRCGCREDLVREDENGFLFDPADRDSLPELLDLLLSRRDDWESMGQKSRQIISNWGLKLFATNLWRSCEIALQQPITGLRNRAVSRAFSLVV